MIPSTLIEIRPAEETDLEAILDLFRNCVLVICRDDYSEEQLNAWASSIKNIQRWMDKINSQYFVVGHVNGNLVGFGSLEGEDVIDLLYVHKDCQGMGVGSKIFDTLVSKVQTKEVNTLKAEVSKTALRFFKTKGFEVVQEQFKQTDDIVLINYQMTKKL